MTSSKTFQLQNYYYLLIFINLFTLLLVLLALWLWLSHHHHYHHFYDDYYFYDYHCITLFLLFTPLLQKCKNVHITDGTDVSARWPQRWKTWNNQGFLWTQKTQGILREFCATSGKNCNKQSIFSSSFKYLCKTAVDWVNRIIRNTDRVTVQWWPVILLELRWNDRWWRSLSHLLFVAITYGKVSVWLWKSLENLGNFFLHCGHLVQSEFKYERKDTDDNGDVGLRCGGKDGMYERMALQRTDDLLACMSNSHLMLDTKYSRLVNIEESSIVDTLSPIFFKYRRSYHQYL